MPDEAVGALEWACFICSMVCVFLYGNSKTLGALTGILAALPLISWGLVSGVTAAALTNVLFLALHTRNLLRALKETAETLSRSRIPEK